MATRPKLEREPVIHGSANVFADLGFADADACQAKLKLAYSVNRTLARRRLTDAATADLLKMDTPELSALRRHLLHRFSIARLMTFLTALDRDVEISIRKKAAFAAGGQDQRRRRIGEAPLAGPLTSPPLKRVENPVPARYIHPSAQVVELVDARDSKSRAREGMSVRVRPWAPIHPPNRTKPPPRIRAAAPLARARLPGVGLACRSSLEGQKAPIRPNFLEKLAKSPAVRHNHPADR